jgi:hypothetical protein
VDISSDCIIKGVFPSPSGTVRFDERLVGLALAVSDNTRNRHKRRGVVASPTSLADCQETSGDSPDVPLSSTSTTVESPAPSPVDPPVSMPSDSIIVEDVTKNLMMRTTTFLPCPSTMIYLQTLWIMICCTSWWRKWD